MWANAPEEDIEYSLPQPEACGWMKNNDGSYMVDWDCSTVQQNVQDTINFLTKGCTCKKGCVSQRCGCRKGGHHCGPGCTCQNCTNVLPKPSIVDQALASNSANDESDPSSSSSDESDETDEETMTDIETEIVFPDIYDEQNNFDII